MTTTHVAAPHPAAPVASVSIARRMAHFANEFAFDPNDHALAHKVRTCLFDCFAGAFASRDLPWSRQAIDYTLAMGDTGASLIGHERTVSWAEAAFANASLAHGLVQEDMHTASVSHIGVVIIPTLLALGERVHASGRDFLAATIVGYQVMARLGRAVVNRDTARTFRPLGMTGAIAGAAAGARLCGLSEDETVSAIALAANTVAGFNEWPRCGGNEMFFHPGFAARNAVTAVFLAQLGARGSESAIDGPGGMLAAFRASDAARRSLEHFDGELEIQSVYHKPVPACNFAQTPAQAALAVSEQMRIDPSDIRSIRVKSFPEAIDYPGCAHTGPFTSILQAKMSIPFAVATALSTGRVAEESYREPRTPQIAALAQRVTLESDAAFARAFPERQGAEVIVELANGRNVAVRLEALRSLDTDAVRARFVGAATHVLGTAQTTSLQTIVDTLHASADVATLARSLRAAPIERD